VYVTKVAYCALSHTQQSTLFQLGIPVVATDCKRM